MNQFRQYAFQVMYLQRKTVSSENIGRSHRQLDYTMADQIKQQTIIR